MKRVKPFCLILILLSFLTIGCNGYMPQDGGSEIIITASCPHTKTVNDGMATKWQNSDKLSVFIKESSTYSNYKFTYTGNDEFNGTLPNIALLRRLYAFYPYSSGYSSPESISVNVTSGPVQNGNDSMTHLAGSGFPLFGVTDGSKTPAFTMNQLLAAGQFNITNGEDSAIRIKSIEFSTPVPVSGEFMIDITGSIPTYTPVKGHSSNTIILSVDNGQEIPSGETASFYAGFVPFDTTGDFRINVVAENNGKEVASSKTIDNMEMVFEAGSITCLNYTFTIPEAAEPVETYLGSFNLVNEDMDSFMAEAVKQYTDSNWHDPAYPNSAHGITIVGDYRNGDNGDLADDPALVTAYSYDLPLPVVIPVEGYNKQSVTINIYGDGIIPEEQYTVTTTVSDSRVKVFNLIPNRRYHYTVTCSGEEISRGYFDTEGMRRIIKVSDTVSADNANNFRDFGGLKTTDSKTLKYGKVFRGTNIDGLSAAEKAYMTDVLNIGLDVDLRREQETGRNQAKRILDASKADYSNVGFIDFNDLKNPVKLNPTMLAILNTLQSGKAVYIHCFAGADRTGCISMLIQALCGVSEKDCTIDYELTSFSCIGKRARTVYNSGFMGYFHPYLAGYRGDTFKEKAENLLLDCGLTAEQIKALQDALIN